MYCTDCKTKLDGAEPNSKVTFASLRSYMESELTSRTIDLRYGRDPQTMSQEAHCLFCARIYEHVIRFVASLLDATTLVRYSICITLVLSLLSNRTIHCPYQRHLLNTKVPLDHCPCVPSPSLDGEPQSRQVASLQSFQFAFGLFADCSDYHTSSTLNFVDQSLCGGSPLQRLCIVQTRTLYHSMALCWSRCLHQNTMSWRKTWWTNDCIDFAEVWQAYPLSVK